jgi:hypothetical protein
MPVLSTRALIQHCTVTEAPAVPDVDDGHSSSIAEDHHTSSVADDHHSSSVTDDRSQLLRHRRRPPLVDPPTGFGQTSNAILGA